MESERPLWDRLLDPLRSEQAAFRVLLGVAGIAAVVIAATLLLRAV